MYTALADAVEQGDANPDVRVMLLHGNGDSFTAGNDLEDFMAKPWKGQTDVHRAGGCGGAGGCESRCQGDAAARQRRLVHRGQRPGRFHGQPVEGADRCTPRWRMRWSRGMRIPMSG